MFRISGYEPGANITCMNVMYTYPYRDEKGKFHDDIATIVYKDNETGEKKCECIPAPEYTYYILKDEYQADHNMAFIEMEKVRPVTCKYRDVLKSIAKETGNLDLFNDNIRTGNYKMNKLFFKDPRVFSADLNIQNFIRMQFAETYKNPVCKTEIAFFDIETDMIDDPNPDASKLGYYPINAISMYHTPSNTVYSFVLRNKRNSQIEELEMNMRKDFKYYEKMVRDFLEKNINNDGDRDKVAEYGLKNIKVVVGFYDTEQEEIVTFFSVLKKLNPDFAVAYNIAFDIRSLIERCKFLGLDPLKVICNEEFKYKRCEYIVDTGKGKDKEKQDKIEEKTDYAVISSFTTYLDQMIIYFSRRKGQAAIENHKLNTVAIVECNVRKVDYHDITGNFVKFPYLDFLKFWLYNVNDTIVQACIEASTHDIQYVFNNVIEMCTPYEKIFRQTNYLGTKGNQFYREHEGLIMGNNVNKFGKKPDTKFAGAFVARPEKISDSIKEVLNGFHILRFHNTNDFDYKRLYPSLLQEFNMATNTMIGKIIIDDSPVNDPAYLKLDAGGTFSENLASYNFIEYCHRWFNLPDVEDALLLMKEYFNTMRTPFYIGNGNGDLPYDKQFRLAVAKVNNTKAIAVERPIPKWVMDEVNKIREGIQLQ